MSGRVGSITTGIITDGLVFHVDAANRASYPKTGTTITDTINNANGTFTSSPTFVNENSGVIDFDGTDRITFTALSNNLNLGISDFSINSWIRTTKTSFQYIIAQGGGSNSAAQRGFGIATNGDGYVYGFIATTTRTFVNTNPTTSVNDGNWHNVAGVWDRSDKLTWYVDGVFDQEGDISSADGYDISYGSYCYLGTYGNATGGYLDGDQGPVQIYNRTLSANEVLHNYNALKGRFGL